MEEIKYQDLEKLLIGTVPALNEKYLSDKKLLRDKPLPHITYGTILIPYIEYSIKNNMVEELVNIFKFIEMLSTNNDPHFVEVVKDSVLENLVGGEFSSKSRKYMGPNTLRLSFEVEMKMNRPDTWSAEMKDWLSRQP